MRKKKPYRKSRRFDSTCRCHGSCPYCREARRYRQVKQLSIDDEEYTHVLHLSRLKKRFNRFKHVGHEPYHSKPKTN